MVSLESIVQRSKDLVYSDLNGEAIILGLKSGKYYGLDETGAFIWEIIQKPARVREIRDLVFERYGVQQDSVETDIIDFIKDLEKEDLVQID